MGGPDLRPGKINPDAGEPEKGAPDVGELRKPSDDAYGTLSSAPLVRWK